MVKSRRLDRQVTAHFSDCFVSMLLKMNEDFIYYCYYLATAILLCFILFILSLSYSLTGYIFLVMV